MYLANFPPPIPPTANAASLADAGALCPSTSPEPIGYIELRKPNLGFIEMLAPLVSSFLPGLIGGKDKAAKQQYNAELAQIRLQRQEDATALALEKAKMAAAPSEQKRQEQLIALVAIGGAGLILSSLLVLGAVRRKD